MFSMQETASSY